MNEEDAKIVTLARGARLRAHVPHTGVAEGAAVPLWFLVKAPAPPRVSVWNRSSFARRADDYSGGATL